jgi:hypothetical protein
MKKAAGKQLLSSNDARLGETAPKRRPETCSVDIANAAAECIIESVGNKIIQLEAGAKMKPYCANAVLQ